MESGLYANRFMGLSRLGARLRQGGLCSIWPEETVSYEFRGSKVVGGAGLTAIERWATQYLDILYHALAGYEVHRLPERFRKFRPVLGQDREGHQHKKADDQGMGYLFAEDPAEAGRVTSVMHWVSEWHQIEVACAFWADQR